MPWWVPWHRPPGGVIALPRTSTCWPEFPLCKPASWLTLWVGRDWYADADQMRDAIAAGRAFNLIYIPFSQKVDVFPAKDDFCTAQLERATRLHVAALAGGVEYPVVSAEDIVLAKLQQYKAGGEVSERQWTDVLKVIRATPDMDWTYMGSWAARLGVNNLLARAKVES
jgi:hypothetical protein